MSRISVLMLTEDSSKQAHATWEALLRAMVRLIEPIRREDLRIDPANEAERRATRANIWESTKAEHHHQRRDLVRTIATRIAQVGNHFVVFHYDGDRAWAKRDECGRHAKFDRLIVSGVKQLLTMPPLNGSPSRTTAEVDHLITRLIAVVPFYSIEAWLYQSTEPAIQRCREQDGDHIDRFAEWRDDRSALDEIEKPKESTCLRDLHNAELAAALPAREVHDARKSFHTAVEALRACPDLCAALQALSTRP